MLSINDVLDFIIQPKSVEQMHGVDGHLGETRIFAHSRGQNNWNNPECPGVDAHLNVCICVTTSALSISRLAIPGNVWK